MDGGKIHYVCLECKGVSGAPGVCKTQECPLKGKELAACSCTDGEHANAVIVETQKDETIQK